MSQWTFIIAAYLVTGVGTLGVTAWAYRAMRKAEEPGE